MKIAITAQGPETTAPLDERFGRARYFHMQDIATGEASTIENSEGANAAHGAGTQAAQILARHGVQAVVTGHVGPKAWSALQASGIRVYTTAGGSVAQAAEAFRAGRLPELTQADGSAQR